ncbi:hypothetical protein GDO78_000278 [Eleutherodactylus coqui]|uniref:Secreted protein n=1 Tax=Eleutherodactylus coqui TaxID=57060 RepID=A0A8J6KF65_ELECQ|nr:hypothetical protein GDO78_000278 [Eleutherodactylus coqui]
MTYSLLGGLVFLLFADLHRGIQSIYGDFFASCIDRFSSSCTDHVKYCMGTLVDLWKTLMKNFGVTANAISFNWNAKTLISD